jgi:hypothetical protein
MILTPYSYISHQNDVTAKKSHQNNYFLEEKVLKFGSNTGLWFTEICDMSSNTKLHKEIQENITYVKLQIMMSDMWNLICTFIHMLLWQVEATFRHGMNLEIEEKAISCIISVIWPNSLNVFIFLKNDHKNKPWLVSILYCHSPHFG